MSSEASFSGQDLPETARTDECRKDFDISADAKKGDVVHQVVDKLVSSCGSRDCFEHVSPVPIPTRESVVEVVLAARRILFPGYFTQARIDPDNLEYYLGQEVTALYQKLSDQIIWAIRHDCYRYEQVECAHCNEQGKDKTLCFLEALPEVRGMLALDVRAAHEGDPASRSYDEIIFSYPGLFAVTVYRLAHVLRKIEVPLLPRIMTEYAHGMTGIDIHPGATIGESFFIDHGTGVVIGETAVIGNGVRLYQGVTLGALSVSRDAVPQLRSAKRHPTIEDDVIVYSGATILGGDTVIGARSVIGGNVWLTESVPPDTKIILKKPELVIVGKKRSHA